MKKLTNKKGFTLMEMIIVIAIIVILAAISIPTLTANLDSANEAADAANLRAAKSAALVYAMDKDCKGHEGYYEISTGEIKVAKDGVTAPTTEVGKCKNHTSSYIKVSYDATTEAPTVEWSNESYKNTCK